MTKEEIFNAVRDTHLVLVEQCFENLGYQAGVEDAEAAMLRHLGLLKEYKHWKEMNA